MGFGERKRPSNFDTYSIPFLSTPAFRAAVPGYGRFTTTESGALQWEFLELDPGPECKRAVSELARRNCGMQALRRTSGGYQPTVRVVDSAVYEVSVEGDGGVRKDGGERVCCVC